MWKYSEITKCWDLEISVLIWVSFLCFVISNYNISNIIDVNKCFLDTVIIFKSWVLKCFLSRKYLIFCF